MDKAFTSCFLKPSIAFHLRPSTPPSAAQSCTSESSIESRMRPIRRNSYRLFCRNVRIPTLAGRLTNHFASGWQPRKGTRCLLTILHGEVASCVPNVSLLVIVSASML